MIFNNIIDNISFLYIFNLSFFPFSNGFYMVLIQYTEDRTANFYIAHLYTFLVILTYYLIYPCTSFDTKDYKRVVACN